MARHIGTRELDAFRAVAQQQSIAQAAKQLHLTPSALSRRIQALEQRLEVELFWRNNQGAELTDHGRKLLHYADLSCLREEEFLAQFRGPGLAGFLRIAGFSSIVRTVVVPGVAPLLRSNPGILVQFGVHESYRLQDLLLDGQADIVISSTECARAGVVCTHLAVERNVLVESTLHRSRDHIYIDLSPRDDFTEKFLRSQSIRPERGFRRSYATDVFGLLDAVEQGLGRAVVPVHIVEPHRTVRRVSGTCCHDVPVLIQHAAGLLESRLARAAIEAIRNASTGLLVEDPSNLLSDAT